MAEEILTRTGVERFRRVRAQQYGMSIHDLVETCLYFMDECERKDRLITQLSDQLITLKHGPGAVEAIEEAYKDGSLFGL